VFYAEVNSSEVNMLGGDKIFWVPNS